MCLCSSCARIRRKQIVKNIKSKTHIKGRELERNRGTESGNRHKTLTAMKLGTVEAVGLWMMINFSFLCSMRAGAPAEMARGRWLAVIAQHGPQTTITKKNKDKRERGVMVKVIAQSQTSCQFCCDTT